MPILVISLITPHFIDGIIEASSARWQDSISDSNSRVAAFNYNTIAYVCVCMHIMEGVKNKFHLKFFERRNCLLFTLANGSISPFLWIGLNWITGMCMKLLLVLLKFSSFIRYGSYSWGGSHHMRDTKITNVGSIRMVVTLASADGMWDTVSLGSLDLLTWPTWRMISGPQG